MGSEFASKSKQPVQRKSSSFLRRTGISLAPPHAILQLQRTIGNQATAQLLQKKTEGGDSERSVELLQRIEEDEGELIQGKFARDRKPDQFIRDAGPSGGRRDMPGALRAGLEALSGLDLSGLRVHLNSSKPARIDSLAYTRGRDIYLGPGQEEHLPHEAWHAVQQIQGRVKPTSTARGVGINDDSRLEREADVMGARALQANGAESVAAGVTHKGATSLQGSPTNGVRVATRGRAWVGSVVQSQKPNPKFKPLLDDAGEKEFKKLVAKYQKSGKTKVEASRLAMDAMFESRVKATGGKRIRGTTDFGNFKGGGFISVDTSMDVSGTRFGRGIHQAHINDDSYNCHSYTFKNAKATKLSKLKSLENRIPRGSQKGKTFWRAVDLVKARIHMDLPMGTTTLGIYPRWIADPNEVRDLLTAYRPRKAGEKLSPKKKDITMYGGAGFPHSAKITRVDKRGNPTRVKGKWGHFSLFEHGPLAVPAHYGKPRHYRKK